MTDSGHPQIGISLDAKPHAYDPAANPELFEGVLTRRLVAFAIDVLIIVMPLVLASLFIFVFGLITFGLGWAHHAGAGGVGELARVGEESAQSLGALRMCW